MNLMRKVSFGRKWQGLLYLISLFGIFACILLSLQIGNAAQAGILFKHITIDDKGPEGIWLKTVGDLNRDGLTDLVAGGGGSGGLVWYQSPGWTKHVIDTGGGFSTDGEVVDVDRDGDQDVVVLTTEDVRWYENPSWTMHIIESQGVHDVEVSDFDGDGDVDLVARNQSAFGGEGNELHFYRQDTPTSWTHRSVSCSNGEGLMVVDVDNDNDQDVVIGGAWFENTKDIIGGAWMSYSYTSAWTHPHAFVSAGDINNDGLMDMVLAPAEPEGGTYKISWFQAPANPRSANWAEHIVEDNVEAVYHFVGVADMDNDGNLDITAAEMQQGRDPDEVKVYLNLDGVGGSWQKQVIATTGSHSMRILDVENDGDNDLYGANWQGNQVELWENQTCPSSLDRWERIVIDPNRPWRAVFITAADMDNDGLQDVVTGGWWYKNPGDQNSSWMRKTIGEPLNNMAAVYDFDGDGFVDVLGTMGQGSDADPRFVWARNNGSGSFSILTNIDQGAGDFLQGVAVGNLESGGALKVGLSWHLSGGGIQMLSVPPNLLIDTWTIVTISTASQDEALSMGDIDQDGDQDLLLGTIWLEQDGLSWNEHLLHETSGSPYGESDPDRNRLADINQDGRLDAVVGYEAISVAGKLAWYEQGQESTAIWQEHPIATVVGPMSLDVADIDRDGDSDVIVGEHNLDDPSKARLLVFENVDGIGNQWQEHLVYQGDEHHDGAQMVDIDGDGDLDIISIGWDHSKVVWYENKGGNCENPSPGNLTPTAPASITSTSSANTSIPPTSAQTDIPVTPIPTPQNGPIPCLAGLAFPMGVAALVLARNSLRR